MSAITPLSASAMTRLATLPTTLQPRTLLLPYLMAKPTMPGSAPLT